MGMEQDQDGRVELVFLQHFRANSLRAVYKIMMKKDRKATKEKM